MIEGQPELDKNLGNSPSKTDLLAKFLTRKWLAILLGVTIGVHALGFTYSRLRAKAPNSDLSPEISLGQFQFVAGPIEGEQTVKAKFSLHVALLSQADQIARRRLADCRFRVQQGIEELLRQAHSGDFDDPLLAGLKRQLQERINETLEIRAIADVIITDFQMERTAQEACTMRETAESAPWLERPPS